MRPTVRFLPSNRDGRTGLPRPVQRGPYGLSVTILSLFLLLLAVFVYAPGQAQAQTALLHYRTPPGSGDWTALPSRVTSGAAVTSSPTGLAAGSDYRVQASVGDGFTTAEEADFTLASTVASVSVSDIQETSAQVTASHSDADGNPVVYFRHREQGAGSWQPTQTVTSASGTATLTLTGLAKDTTHQVAASLEPDFSTGRTVNFSTLANRVPRFPSGNVARQVENHSPEGSGVGAPVTAEDTDPLTYSLGGSDAGSFDIDPSSGQIKVGAGVSLDRTVRASYSVTVTARDPDGATAAATVAIEVVFPRYVEPQGVEGVGLLERVCASAIPGSAGIPGCPVTLVPLMPLIGVGMLFALGARNPVVLGAWL